jgi:hypothetical protein
MSVGSDSDFEEGLARFALQAGGARGAYSLLLVDSAVVAKLFTAMERGCQRTSCVSGFPQIPGNPLGKTRDDHQPARRPSAARLLEVFLALTRRQLVWDWQWPCVHDDLDLEVHAVDRLSLDRRRQSRHGRRRIGDDAGCCCTASPTRPKPASRSHRDANRT